MSLVWARYKFFKVDSKNSKVGSKLYDPIVVGQIIVTFYLASSFNYPILVSKWIGILLYLIGFSLFLWAINTASNLDFAFSDSVDSLVTTGPYRYIRHPFYVSYMLVWVSSSIVFNSLILWITLMYLVTFYILSARKEEKVILESEYSREYREYRKKVGMFLPRIEPWKS